MAAKRVRTWLSVGTIFFGLRAALIGCGGTESPSPSAAAPPASDAGASGDVAPRQQAAQPVLFVGNLGAGTVTMIHGDTLEVIGTLNVIPDGDMPHDPAQAAIYPAIVQAKGLNFVQGIAVAPDARTLYVSRGYLGDVAALDLSSGKVRWRLQALGMRADHIALSADGKRLFVSSLTANTVQVIDTARAAFTDSFPAGTYPHVLRFTPDGKFLAVGSLGNTSAGVGMQGQQSLTFVDANTFRIDRTLPFDAGVRPFVFSPDGKTVYLQLSLLNGIVAADAHSGAILHKTELPVAGPGKDLAPLDYPNQAAHHGVAMSADSRTLCEAATISNYVALLDRATLGVQAIVPVGDQPAEAETSLDGRYCFVTNRGPASNTLSVIAYAERREVARIPVGLRPQELTQALVPSDVLAGFARDL